MIFVERKIRKEVDEKNVWKDLMSLEDIIVAIYSPDFQVFGNCCLKAFIVHICLTFATCSRKEPSFKEKAI